MLAIDSQSIDPGAGGESSGKKQKPRRENDREVVPVVVFHILLSASAVYGAVALPQGSRLNGGYWSVTSMNAYPETRSPHRITPSTN